MVRRRCRAHEVPVGRHGARIARTAFRFEEERAEAGRSTLFDYNDARTRMLRAESELIRSKYEYLFRCKILDFYRGEPLAL